ncbi:MAG: 1,2-phenylacetyl-CoA epoxidase subunit PaaD [Ardenticatenia bacterium]|nr:1,2-phenylacetyl-CoA epoxidase subunit PaaD [Ardenticatenia bacterium]
MSATSRPSDQAIWAALDDVKDPEVPVVSVVEMGIIQGFEWNEAGRLVVRMTPTFTGCPAIEMMRQAIRERLAMLGVEATVEVVLDPPWTSDRIADSAREKMKQIGLAPPARHGGMIELDLIQVVRCPYCNSDDTTLENPFGPTLCRAMYYCNACQQPFEKFKAL